MRFGKRLKKICAVFATLMMLDSAVMSFAASDSRLDNAVFELSSLGIFMGDEKGNLNLNDRMTRAEFAKITAVMTGCDEVAAQISATDLMADVPSEHWAAGYINYCVSFGLMLGDGDGDFRPEDDITLEECIKTLVVVMGYEVVAQGSGGYPSGFYSVAQKKKLLDGVTGIQNEPAVRQDILFLIYNSLDVPNLVGDYAAKKSYKEDSERTIRSIIEDAKDINVITGVVTANSETWLKQENPTMTVEQIEIDGILFDTDERMRAQASGYIGQEVTAYYKDSENMRYPLIYNIQPTLNNTITEIPLEDLKIFTASEISYWKDGGTKQASISIADNTKFVYNSRLESRFLDLFAEIENGDITVIDNNGDRQIDFVFINEYKSYLVESANANGNLKVKYIGSDYGKLMVLYDNILLDTTEENAFVIKNADGTEIAYDELKKGDVISVFENNYDSFVRIVRSDAEILQGSVSAKDAENTVHIGDEEYRVDRDEVFEWIRTGEVYDFYFDAFGNITYVVSDNAKSEEIWKYGYIYRAFEETLGQRYVTMINAGVVENREEINQEDRTDANTVPVTLCQNESVVNMEVADSFIVDGCSVDDSKITDFVGKPIKYRVDSAGKLKKIETLEFAGGAESTIYNAKEKVFGTSNVVYGTPFLLNEKTKVLCIPEGGVASKQDLLVRLTIDNKDEDIRYNAIGYDLDEETKAVKVFVLVKDMDSSAVAAVVPKQAKLGVVQKAAEAWSDEEEDVCMNLTMMVGAELKKNTTLSLSERPQLETLKKGDVIFFEEDADGRVENAIVVNNVYGVLDGDSGTDNHDINQIIGYVQEVRLNEINNMNRIRVNQLDVITVDGLEAVDVPISNYPDIFIYYTRSDIIESGTIDDIIPYAVPVDNPEQVLIVKSGTTIRGIVIIK